ncbi:MAG: hypothetical protein ACJAYU_003362 [Bradymonadia bacterium]|jgi:uncharacterized protein (DUF697 family)
MAKSAERIIQNHVVLAVGAGIIPLPFLDLAAVTAVQIDMLQELARHYGQDLSRNQLKTFATAVTGSSLARLGASLVKSIPVFGSLVGGFSMSILSGASTYAVGEVARQQFEGDFRGFDVDRAKSDYEREFERGKEVAKDAERSKSAAGPVDKGDVFDQLAKLGELRDSGVLTEEEFAAKKRQLLDKIGA